MGGHQIASIYATNVAALRPHRLRPPGTGKTTLAQRLAEDLRLPLISKDRIKEILFDTLGWSDREWSRKLGAATMELLYSYMEIELAAGRSFVVECNFRPEHATARFLQLKERYGYEPFQVQCCTEGEVLLHASSSGPSWASGTPATWTRSPTRKLLPSC